MYGLLNMNVSILFNLLNKVSAKVMLFCDIDKYL